MGGHAPFDAGAGESIDPDVLNNRTVANDAPIGARALLFIVPGHTQHHLEILRARYGVGGGGGS